MPAKAGIHLRLWPIAENAWIPAYTGMTKEKPSNYSVTSIWINAYE
jgi:hypothetical protein